MGVRWSGRDGFWGRFLDAVGTMWDARNAVLLYSERMFNRSLTGWVGRAVGGCGWQWVGWAFDGLGWMGFGDVAATLFALGKWLPIDSAPFIFASREWVPANGISVAGRLIDNIK